MRVRILGQYGNAALLLLWAAEFAALLVSTRIACWFGYSCLDDSDYGLLALSYAVVASLWLIAMGLYSARQRERFVNLILRLTLALLLGAFVIVIASQLIPVQPFARRDLMISTAIGWALTIAIRAISIRTVGMAIFKKRVLVYGAAKRALIIARLRRASDRRGFVVKAYMAAAGELELVPHDQIIRDTASIAAAVEALGIDEIVVAMDERRRNFPSQELLDCRMAGIQVSELTTFLERETGKLRLETLNPSWLIFASGFQRDAFRRYSERVFDLIASLAILIVGAPIMLLVALAIKLEDGWHAKVLYRQARVGYGGRIFDVVKFRSMRSDAEDDGKAVWASANDDRATRVGAVIRKLRFDELPQLWNVLTGRMAFVGPRPERPEFVDTLAAKIPFFRERHHVKPGITGWAQLCYPYGASEQDAREKLQYDLYYVKNHSLLFDLLILLQTVEVILLGKGAR